MLPSVNRTTLNQGSPNAAMRLLLDALAVFLVNPPFGYWRAGVPKFLRQWFLPVPAAIALRVFGGLGRQLIPFPAPAGAFFLGQSVGGKVRALKN